MLVHLKKGFDCKYWWINHTISVLSLSAITAKASKSQKNRIVTMTNVALNMAICATLLFALVIYTLCV